MSADEEDDFASEVLAGLRSKPAEAPERRFAAWHRPRKQWIRNFQWRDEVARLMDERPFRKGEATLRYLGLPGEDLLDVRLLHELCHGASKKLHYVGFVAAKGPDRVQLNESVASMGMHPTISPQSRIVPSRIEALARKDSPEHATFCDASPYHVVNIDLTGHLARRAADMDSYILALGNIVGEQIRKAYAPWLLFLTTRVGVEGVHERNLKGFIQAVVKNVESSPAFADGVKGLLCAGADDLIAVIGRPHDFSVTAFRDFFCLGFGKWLLSLITSGVPPQHAEMLRSCHYSVGGEHPDMLSLGFRVVPQQRGPNDGFGLLEPLAEDPQETEVQLGIQMLAETRNLIDLDHLIRHDPELREQMILETIAMLKEANYMRNDEAGASYRSWVAGEA